MSRDEPLSKDEQIEYRLKRLERIALHFMGDKTELDARERFGLEVIAEIGVPELRDELIDDIRDAL